MMQGLAVEDVMADLDVAPRPHESSFEAIKARLVAHLARLGVREPALVEMLADECLHRARRRAAPGSQVELLRRTLEEAQRRFDHAIAHALNLVGSKDFRTVAGARAALLLGDVAGISGDYLFRRHEDQAEMASRLRAAMPLATPPESNLAMPDQPISFFFSSSPKARQ